MSSKGWIGVDLDGTLAQYSGWVNETTIGEPVPLMLDRVKAWLAQGKDVRIFTARVTNALPSGLDIVSLAISDWCLKHIGQRLPITNVKDYGLYELWDDRAVQVIPNTGLRADGVDNEINCSTSVHTVVTPASR